jgi:cytochrome P450
LIRICLSNISALNSLIENVLPAQIPTPRRSRFARAVAELDAIIFDIIARRRSDPGGQDLLSLLIQVADTEDGSMSDRQLRDEAMTMFVAGHETTAVTLSWACMLLGRHPESQRRLHAELDEVAGNRAITVEDLPKLRYAEQVIKEALRLYPPAYVYARQPRRDVELGGYRVPAKTLVMNSPWLMQRDPRLFADALEFRPERWEGDFERSLPNGAYIPFGLGGRRCVGQAFAISESVAVLVTLMQRYRLEPLDAETKSQVAMTLRPRRLNMRVLSRERQN